MIKEPVRHCAMEMESRMRQGTRHRKLPLTVSRCEEGEGEPCHRGGTAFQVGTDLQEGAPWQAGGTESRPMWLE